MRQQREGWNEPFEGKFLHQLTCLPVGRKHTFWLSVFGSERHTVRGNKRSWCSNHSSSPCKESQRNGNVDQFGLFISDPPTLCVHCYVLAAVPSCCFKCSFFSVDITGNGRLIFETHNRLRELLLFLFPSTELTCWLWVRQTATLALAGCSCGTTEGWINRAIYGGAGGTSAAPRRCLQRQRVGLTGGQKIEVSSENVFASHGEHAAEWKKLPALVRTCWWNVSMPVWCSPPGARCINNVNTQPRLIHSPTFAIFPFWFHIFNCSHVFQNII